jgi:hypothetical protein
MFGVRVAVVSVEHRFAANIVTPNIGVEICNYSPFIPNCLYGGFIDLLGISVFGGHLICFLLKAWQKFTLLPKCCQGKYELRVVV